VSTSQQQPPPCTNLNNAPAAGNNWSQLHHLPGGHFNNKSPSKKCIHDSTTVVDGRSSGVHIQQQQEHQAGSTSPSEPIYSNGQAQTTVGSSSSNSRVVNYYASTSSSGGADADYVNYEMFASHQYSWSNHQKQLEPDLIRNLPYQQQQQQQQQQQSGSTVAAPINGHSPAKQPGNAPFITANPSPHHRHSNRVHPR
jgi:hypothetical protein